jgi:hypothetical protein
MIANAPAAECHPVFCAWKADSHATMAEQQAIGKTAQRASAQVTADSQ